MRPKMVMRIIRVLASRPAVYSVLQREVRAADTDLKDKAEDRYKIE
ncbi:MAG: hypothetical protein ACW99U_12860 [Candidatus Thorarchaeota archaeon]